jgi:hypothetical protein
MKRYHKLLAGASWMAEYGNPDTDDWEFLQQYSPYHSTFLNSICCCSFPTNVLCSDDFPPLSHSSNSHTMLRVPLLHLQQQTLMRRRATRRFSSRRRPGMTASIPATRANSSKSCKISAIINGQSTTTKTLRGDTAVRRMLNKALS